MNHGLLSVLMENAEGGRITNGDFDRAFTELASLLYEHYRKQKRAEEQELADTSQ